MSINSTIRNKYIELDDFQIKSFNAIDTNINVLVSAPTGSGKTLIADYAIEHAKLINPKAKIIYTCPIKALCNEKYRDMVLYWGSYGYKIGLMTGDIIINPYGHSEIDNDNDNNNDNNNEIINQYGDIVIMTTEVLQKLLESSDTNISLFNPDVIIFDEAHYINDDSRGHVWEKCIIGGLNMTNALLILLSATIGNITEITNWLNSINSDKKFISVIKTQRPVPLRQFVIDNTKSRIFKKITAENDDEIRKVSSDPDPESYELMELNGINYDRVKRYWTKLEDYGYSEKFELQTLCNQIKSNPELGVPAIIFVLSKKKCVNLAESIEETTYVSPEEQSQILKFYDGNLKEYTECSQYIDLRKIIQKGIAYHHSGLIPKIREVVEFLIKNKLIKIVFATETFAVGLNFPVKTVVITSLTKPTDKGFRYLTVSEYKQMAGRAGRRFLDPFGNVILMLFNTKKKTKYPYNDWASVNNIIDGPVNNVESKYIIEPNYILKNITSGLHRQMSLKSFRYYRSTTISRDIDCPEKFIKLFNIDKKIKEFAQNGINYKDKNYSKLYSKLSLDDKKIYQDLLKYYATLDVKTDLELYFDLENSIVQFLSSEKFIEKSTNTDSGWILTSKGNMYVDFNEINPIVFGNHKDHIMSKSDLIIPTLSMFIDDGIKIEQDEFINWNEVEPAILYWEQQINIYSRFINKFPKWTYWPKNYLIIKEWLENPNISLDQIAYTHSIDIGLFVKILIKLYQIIDELIGKLDKLNMTEYTDKLTQQKNLLIRYPLKIDSLYVNL